MEYDVVSLAATVLFGAPLKFSVLTQLVVIELSVKDGGGVAITIVKFLSMISVPPICVFLALIENVAVPTDVGVPEIVKVLMLKESPADAPLCPKNP
jgi:hypothetical protein